MIDIHHHSISGFIELLHKHVSKEFVFRIYPYEKLDILVCYFRGFKYENWQLDKKFFMMDDKEKWKNVIRLRRRVEVVKKIMKYDIARDIRHVAEKVYNDRKYISSISK